MKAANVSPALKWFSPREKVLGQWFNTPAFDTFSVALIL
jgi:hypothetical protein